MKEKKCNVIVAKPTPSPTPMEELEDIPDDEYIPYEENEQNNHENNDDEITRKRQNDDADDEEDNEISEWSDDNDEI
ncbi:hypothetical protein TRFO_18660 [Tritrichomonas foetus]|uniref:Uncharacterized protein n=1 Tax=Tritrichomonas foetus TaxID=1144522 RepID=A0A1J4KPQ3_9EUKA|nr:hypothetical protein TRFO_18660 [Tritrichomonas foetus]|eukprot:OHT11772.1 hypothetical protein TRFO_18660 [Tritrichomonas foetus]